jgi:hypothetical protein
MRIGVAAAAALATVGVFAGVKINGFVNFGTAIVGTIRGGEATLVVALATGVFGRFKVNFGAATVTVVALGVARAGVPAG